jgi:hypothetical protein
MVLPYKASYLAAQGENADEREEILLEAKKGWGKPAARRSLHPTNSHHLSRIQHFIVVQPRWAG